MKNVVEFISFCILPMIFLLGIVYIGTHKHEETNPEETHETGVYIKDFSIEEISFDYRNRNGKISTMLNVFGRTNRGSRTSITFRNEEAEEVFVDWICNKYGLERKYP